MEGKGHGLVQRIIPAFVWRDWWKKRKSQSKIVEVHVGVERSISRVQVKWDALPPKLSGSVTVYILYNSMHAYAL
jgi:hypothetical protein